MPGQDLKPTWCKSDPPLSYFNVQNMIWPDGGKRNPQFYQDLILSVSWHFSDENSMKGLDILIYLTMNQLPYLISSAPTLGKIK